MVSIIIKYIPQKSLFLADEHQTVPTPGLDGNIVVQYLEITLQSTDTQGCVAVGVNLSTKLPYCHLCLRDAEVRQWLQIDFTALLVQKLVEKG